MAALLTAMALAAALTAGRPGIDARATFSASPLFDSRAVAGPSPVQAAGEKGEPSYPALGAGHFVKAIREEGRFVTLEDNSLWEIAPVDRYLASHWEVEAGISVRQSGGDDGYVYEIANLDEDEGVSARWVRR